MRHRKNILRFTAPFLCFFSPKIRGVVRLGLMAAVLAAPAAGAWQMQSASIMTDWSRQVDPQNPWPEYPRPQMVRSDWLNLNGIWQFQPGNAGDPVPAGTLSSEILVPFPMESAISGVKQHHDYSWYRRTFTVPAAWSGQRILLHFGAIDWEAEVFINGTSLGIHQGGGNPFSYDITAQVAGSGPHILVVRVYDPTDNTAGSLLPIGKQRATPGGIFYTACSGIWQTVWLEPVPSTSIADLRLIPDIDQNQLKVTATVSGPAEGITVTAIARMGSAVVGTVSGAPGAELLLPVPSARLWSPADPFLYDLEVVLSSGGLRGDWVTGYFGMRKASVGPSGGFAKMLLNNTFLFQYGMLDQGYWPDGNYTAPTDRAMKADIEQAKLLGFNMLRKHMKVEPARWYYWCDKIGILVWQDMVALKAYQPVTEASKPIYELEAERTIRTRWNHPSIMVWTMFNESWGQFDTERITNNMMALDPSRIVECSSGSTFFEVGHVRDSHNYPGPVCPVHATKAVVCGEYGGVGLRIAGHAWNGNTAFTAATATDGNDLANYLDTYSFQLASFGQNNGLSAAVYTQITDVEEELNGLYTYDRKIRKPSATRVQAMVATASSPVSFTEIVPSSQAAGQTWRYTTTTPASNWYATAFDDSAWNSGPGGFGTFTNGNPNGPANSVPRTPWGTASIWLRRTFNPGSLTADQISRLVFHLYHDENVEIYINGVPAGARNGFTQNYIRYPMNEAGKAALVPNATNVLAVRCTQTTGKQYIDVGIHLPSATAVPPAGSPIVPTGLLANAATGGVTVSWNASPEATNYQLKRSLNWGGPYAAVATPPINAVTDTGANPATRYFYVVSAVNSAGESADSTPVSSLPETYGFWKLARLGDANAPDEGDPDGDGISNLMEYALDLNPISADAGGLPQSQAVADPAGQPAGAYQALAFLRARSDLTYEVLQSSDLMQWTVVQTNPGTVGQTVTVLRPVSGTKGFLRLRVTIP
jgi:hypothetical protein